MGIWVLIWLFTLVPLLVAYTTTISVPHTPQSPGRLIASVTWFRHRRSIKCVVVCWHNVMICVVICTRTVRVFWSPITSLRTINKAARRIFALKKPWIAILLLDVYNHGSFDLFQAKLLCIQLRYQFYHLPKDITCEI